MGTKIPVTIEGNLASDPEVGVSNNGTEWARFSVAVNDRRLNEETQQWENGDVVFHNVATFGRQAKNVAESLKKGDSVLVTGDLRFSTFTDKDGNTREQRQIVADNVAASLKFTTVQIADNAPKARGPEAYATGPVATPDATSGAAVTR